MATRKFVRLLGMAFALVALGRAEDAIGAAEYKAYLYDPSIYYFLRQESSPLPPQFIQGSGVEATSNYWYVAGTFPGLAAVDFSITDFSSSAVGVDKQCGASARIDDLVITDGTGVSKPVSVYVRFDVEGVATTAGGGGTGGNSVDVDAYITVGLGGGQSSMWSPGGGNFSNPWPSTGVFAGIDTPTLQGTFQVGPFGVSTEVPNTLVLANHVGIGPSAWSGGWIEGTCRLTAGLTRSQPAIVLPPGFVANSAQGRIENNWFVSEVTRVAETTGRGPGLELGQNAPNPFYRETAIAYTLPRRGRARLQVLDVNGARVAELVAGEQNAGSHLVRWNGLDHAGRRASPGVYFYALEANGERTMRRMVLIR